MIMLKITIGRWRDGMQFTIEEWLHCNILETGDGAAIAQSVTDGQAMVMAKPSPSNKISFDGAAIASALARAPLLTSPKIRKIVNYYRSADGEASGRASTIHNRVAIAFNDERIGRWRSQRPSINNSQSRSDCPSIPPQETFWMPAPLHPSPKIDCSLVCSPAWATSALGCASMKTFRGDR